MDSREGAVRPATDAGRPPESIAAANAQFHCGAPRLRPAILPGPAAVVRTSAAPVVGAEAAHFRFAALHCGDTPGRALIRVVPFHIHGLPPTTDKSLVR